MAQTQPQNQAVMSAMERYQPAGPPQNDDQAFVMKIVMVTQITKNNLQVTRQIQKQRTTNQDKVKKDQLSPGKGIYYKRISSHGPENKRYQL